MSIRLTQAATKTYREAKLKEQGGRCALTGYTISAAEAVLDHDHATGHVRAKWVGHVTIHGDTHQRRFSTEPEAADWVVCKRKELHGEYAKA